MKSFMLLSYFLYVIALESIVVYASSAPEAIRDIAGHKLEAGSEYYILPVIRGHGGGLTIGSPKNGTCPLDVVQEHHEVANGLPLILSPVNPKKSTIRISTDHNIKFKAYSICVQSMVWQLKNFDEASQQWYVTMGGVEGNPGHETVGNWFKIEKYDADYKLVFCPGVCDFCKVICRDIGIFIDDGVRRLALSDKPLKIMFKRV